MPDLTKLEREWQQEIEAARRLQKLNAEITAIELHDCPKEIGEPWDDCAICAELSQMIASRQNLQAGYGSDWAAILAEVFPDKEEEARGF